MGMFDYIEVPTIAKFLNLRNPQLQTKDLDCNLDKYIVLETILLKYENWNDNMNSKLESVDFSGEISAYIPERDISIDLVFDRGVLTQMSIPERKTTEK